MMEVTLFVLFGCLLLLGPPVATKSSPSWPRDDDSVFSLWRARRAVKHSATRAGWPANESQILLDTSAPISKVDPQFLSVTIDAGAIRENWTNINFTAPRIINMARALNPAMLRVGGTSGDYIFFNATTTGLRGSETNFTMTPAQWDAVNQFVKVVGWEFIFGLNGLLRSPYPNGVWYSANARQLITYSTFKGYDVQWELGNEPDHWKRDITPAEHAKDFMILSEILSEVKPLGTMMAGPDVADSMEYFAEFIGNMPKGMLGAATYHQYYANGKTGTLPEFYDVDLLDEFIYRAIFFQSATDIMQPQAGVWLGETASLYDGGTPHLSDAYVAGFMWLDKLGIAAAVGHKRVFRQSFVGGSYGLLDSDQNPMPDYWLSVLYKKLVGTKVLYVDSSLEHGRQLRVYAHCAKSPYPAGSVVLLLLNMDFSPVEVPLLNSELVSSERDVFWLLPPAGNLTSTAVQLNGVTLQLVADTELPYLKPEEQPASSSLSLPDISFGFIVFKTARVDACL